MGIGELPLFPARPVFLAYTFFADGHTLLVSNSELQSRMPPDTATSVCWLRDVDTPEEFVARCQREVRELLDAGRLLAPALTPEELIARLTDLREKTGEGLRRQGYYSWREAFARTFAPLPREEL
jgi:hypothetical protein